MREPKLFSSAWQPDPGVTAAVRRAGESLISEGWSLLESAVGLDSSPDDFEGLDRLVELFRPRFDTIGLSTSVERTADGHPVLHAVRPTGERADPTCRVLLVGHLDTVFPAGTVGGWPMDRDDERATGPGIADAKGGAVVLWLALAAALDATDGLPGVQVHVILNTDEEAGSVQSRPIFEREAVGADLALIFEPGRPDGSIVRQRRGARRYRITVTGKAAHTGVEPWAGINAIEAAAHKVLALQALNDRERFLSVTVAVVHGGSRVNVVPAEAVLDVDTRLPDDAAAESTHAAVEGIVAREDVAGAAAAYEIISDRPPLMPQPAVPTLLERFRQAGQAVGVAVQDTATGGGSDGCFISKHGVPTIDALGPVGGGYHTRDEFLLTESLLQRALLSGLFLTGLVE